MSLLPPTARRQVSRRAFLGTGAASVGAAVPLQALLGSPSAAAHTVFSSDYGAPEPTADGTTGEFLLMLPPGFSYFSYGWTGDPIKGAKSTPGRHDGMGVVLTKRYQVVLVRNHEQFTLGRSFGERKITYDRRANGGTTNLLFDQQKARWKRSWVSLAGTSANCAGGPTPWGSWLTCEETLVGPEFGFKATHGWIFEVPGSGRAKARPLEAMGRFLHEAVAVDPVTGWAYETEDHNPCGFYRFVANTWGALDEGGQLQMLKVEGAINEDLRGSISIGSEYPVEWVDIADPTRAHAGLFDAQGVSSQGFALGGALFTRGEGCWYDGGRIHFVCTDGGSASKGQVWEYDPGREMLKLVFESPGELTLNHPDNLAVSPRGGVILCEDGEGTAIGGNRLLGLTREGELFVFAENAIAGSETGEWAGATFSPSGPWLFANIQEPGVTFAITGPWNNGAL